MTFSVAALQSLDESFMPDTCDLLEPGSVVVNPDGSTDHGTVTTANVSCRMTTVPMAMELLIAMRLANVANSVLHVPLGTVVHDQDQVNYRGKIYEVAGTNDGASYATSLALALKLVQ